jgi:hypothetical protein
VIKDEAHQHALELFAAYPEVTLREGTEDSYVRYLAELDKKDVVAVLPDLIRSSTRMPSVADIRHRIAKIQLDLPSPLEAYRSVTGPSTDWHPLTRYVVEIFGGQFNIKNSDLPAATRKQFIDFYSDVRDETVRRGQLPRAVLEAQKRRAKESERPEQPSVWTAIRERFDALPSEERTRRTREARKALLSRGDINPDWLARPVIEHEALRVFGEENGWLDRKAS